jgi:hypothetical protein
MREAVSIIFAIVGGGFTIVIIKLSMIERRLNRLSRLDAKIDALLKAAGIEFDEFQGVPPAVREALERGDPVLAITRFREMTGVGLTEAKRYVDDVRHRGVAAS